LSVSDVDYVQYVEGFMRDFHAWLVEFIPTSSRPDSILLDELQLAMEKYDMTRHKNEVRRRQNKPPLTFDAASQQVPKGVSDQEHTNRTVELMTDDLMTYEGIYQLWDALAFKRLLDKARIHGLIRDSESARHKLKDCEENKAEIEKKLAKAAHRITQLESLVRLYGGDPNVTLSGDVHEGGS
jgi:hypothetical protein